eukprot:CAMPEP_0197836412 /NCGR_PEP_ID=MMETSP1437-20131217/28896_1 /TAXON_ID=49252 ORGANISM="Eucampia antarctica, Strain CCMP1452" /NCGR_SAMPLE_ID=MMETSP1437 /ASSEMBLY_ACC=CAM_ASM_001096 /LENGTH=591 /DNA_ID=CAMNT_0043442569 /DNA_START=42 /DNA_END=1814 /DNA_ORIENTATION=-
MIASPQLVNIDVSTTRGMSLSVDASSTRETQQHQQQQQQEQCISSSIPESLPRKDYSCWTIGATDTTRSIMPPTFDQQTSPESIPTTLSSLSQPLGPDTIKKDTNDYIGNSSVSLGSPNSEDTNSYQRSHYQDRIINQPSHAVETVLSAACETMGFDIAELWLRTGPKTHQLTNTHLQPTSVDNSVRKELVDVYYGARSSEGIHTLSPALCKRAKEAQDVVWVTSLTEHGAAALRCSISDVRTAVAVPVCHKQSQTNMTILYFSVQRTAMNPLAVEFLAHMSLAAANVCVNSLAVDIFSVEGRENNNVNHTPPVTTKNIARQPVPKSNLSQSEHPLPRHHSILRKPRLSIPNVPEPIPTSKIPRFSVTGTSLDLRWSNLSNVEYLTDGGNSWIHTAVLNRHPVVVKWLKPECQDLAVAINEIEAELDIHAQLQHSHIVSLCGAGLTSKGSRFMVLERLDGGSLTQVLGYDTRIRDRRRRFWKKKHFTYVEVLKCARSIAEAMEYLHSDAIPGCMVLHRDLKPDNIGFTLDGTIKLIDFGLARVVENSSPDTDELYEMSGETGSLRYMAPEVADGQPYNHKADVYSFGIILW